MTPIILRQDFGNHTRFVDWVTIFEVHLPERAETGGPYKNGNIIQTLDKRGELSNIEFWCNTNSRPARWAIGHRILV